MPKASSLAVSPRDDISRLIDSITRLDLENQDRMFRLITLIAAAPSSQRARALERLAALLGGPADIAQVDALIDYLDANAAVIDEMQTAGQLQVAALLN